MRIDQVRLDQIKLHVRFSSGRMSLKTLVQITVHQQAVALLKFL